MINGPKELRFSRSLRMPGHNSRSNMVDVDVDLVVVSRTAGEKLDDFGEWGREFQIVTAGAEARTLSPPTGPGQRCTLTLTVAGGTATVTLSGGGTVDGTNDTMTFDAAGEALVLESVTIAPGVYTWVIIHNLGSVGLST